MPLGTNPKLYAEFADYFPAAASAQPLPIGANGGTNHTETGTNNILESGFQKQISFGLTNRIVSTELQKQEQDMDAG